MALVYCIADFLGPHRSQSRGNHFLSSKVACLLTRNLGLDPLLERTSLELCWGVVVGFQALGVPVPSWVGFGLRMEHFCFGQTVLVDLFANSCSLVFHVCSSIYNFDTIFLWDFV